MMKIAICDDDYSVHECMKGILEKYGADRQIGIETLHFHTAGELLDAGEGIQALFLEVEMPGMDGIEAADIWNRKGYGCKIIMLTGHLERVKEFFKIGVFRLVTKPIDSEEVFEAMDGVRSRMLGQQQVTLGKNGREYTFSQIEILYCMSEKNTVHIYTRKDHFTSRHTLLEWADMLDGKLFFQCHKSYIVNLSKIQKIEKQKLILKSGEWVQVSRRRYAQLLRMLAEFDTKRR